jgi:antitoxin (DNA-binding transcriptional repressor) of toxin-antitoxin stability system
MPEGRPMTATVQDAQADLMGLLRRLPPGETLTLTDADVPVAKVEAIPTPRKDRVLGTMKGTVLYMAPDFRDTPEGFEECTG